MKESFNLKFYLRDRFFLALTLVAFFFGLGSAILVPSIYEASLEIALAKISYRKAGAIEDDTTSKVIPSVIEARKLLLKPDEISNAMLISCGYLPQDVNRIKLARSIKAYRSDTNGERLFVVVNSQQQDQAFPCASALSEKIISFSQLEKKQELNRLMALSDAKVFSVDAHISRPIMVSDKKTSKPLNLFFGIFFSVILLGCICRKLYKNIIHSSTRA